MVNGVHDPRHRDALGGGDGGLGAFADRADEVGDGDYVLFAGLAAGVVGLGAMEAVAVVEDAQGADFETAVGGGDGESLDALADAQDPGALEEQDQVALEADAGEGVVVDVIVGGVPGSPAVGDAAAVAERTPDSAPDAEGRGWPNT